MHTVTLKNIQMTHIMQQVIKFINTKTIRREEYNIKCTRWVLINSIIFRNGSNGFIFIYLFTF